MPSSDDDEEESAKSGMMAHIMTYIEALHMCETLFQERS
jgi:hypothetical protein